MLRLIFVMALFMACSFPSAYAHDPFEEGLASGDGRTVEWRGTKYRTLLSGEESGGAMSVIANNAPPGMGPPRHVHANEDEVFIILEGSYEFLADGKRFERKPGEVVFVPRGVDHTFRNKGKSEGRHLIILTPSGFERFFQEMAKGKYRIPEDMKQINESATRHALTFTGPPLTDEN